LKDHEAPFPGVRFRKSGPDYVNLKLD